MKTISNRTISEYEIKNSKFITILYKVDNQFSLEGLITQVKKEYPKATHYCYAYRTENEQKSSDDGEPGGTAGLPMLNVLIKEELINVLAITVRYFGGIKLGSGGLVRAYTKSLTLALANANILEVVEGYEVKLSINYNEQKQLDYLLKDINVINKEFNDQVYYFIEISKNDLSLLDNYNYEIIKTKLIENRKRPLA